MALDFIYVTHPDIWEPSQRTYTPTNATWHSPDDDWQAAKQEIREQRINAGSQSVFVSQQRPFARMTNGRCYCADGVGKGADDCARVARGDCRVADGMGTVATTSCNAADGHCWLATGRC